VTGVTVPAWAHLRIASVGSTLAAAGDWTPGGAAAVAADVANYLSVGYGLPVTPGAQAISYALEELGKTYQWAGAGPASFDCSGLTMMAPAPGRTGNRPQRGRPVRRHRRKRREAQQVQTRRSPDDELSDGRLRHAGADRGRAERGRPMAFVLLCWIAFAALGYAVGNSKGRATEGLLLGLFLGLIGLIIIACLKPKPGLGGPPSATWSRPIGSWANDPYGRHEKRWWNGTGWTEQVSNGGFQSVDHSIGMAPPPPQPGRW
jgi:hypothetical protein